ncbi:SH3 domain-containing protein [Phenylobacterium sp. LjRoot225]|uniref:SH3 domain-containing protein n=1 Tax=Phenylobacterium sp. LjRoot225 TaxID=3342285 RepID=UPI003ECF0909
MAVMMRALLAAATLGAALVAGAAEAADRATPSGLPVPRYVSLKFDKVNARAGPGDDHRLLWVYRVRGLPVQVVAETAEWRRICDPEGELVWVHKRTTDGRRTAMNMQATPLPLRRRPKDVSHVVAYLNPRALAALVRCEEGWCRVKADDVSGWMPESKLWGTSEAIQCRPGRTHGQTHGTTGAR